ncbi:MAG: hypothetical protein GX604_05910 [Actinobacteria bacterium]|nr:hypothetical protein [Actinomycetota bacterium]
MRKPFLRMRSQREPQDFPAETAVDPTLDALPKELLAFGAIKTPADTKARTWSRMEEEIQSQQRRGRFVAAPSPRFGARGRRWAAVTVLAMAAVVLAVAGLRSEDPQRMIADGPVATVTTVTEDPSVSTATVSATAPHVTGETSGGSGNTSPDAQGSQTTGGSTPSGTTVTAAGGSTATTDGGAVKNGTTASVTTVIEPTSTSGQQLMTKQQRESSARSAVNYVAQAVLNRDSGAVSSLMTEEARGGLVQLASSLQNPIAYYVSSVVTESDKETRVALHFTDRVLDPEGQEQQVQRRFLLTVLIDENRVLITQVNALP